MSEEAEEEIKSVRVNASMAKSAAALLERCRYTTVALQALAKVHAELDDAVGARLLNAYAAEFREHEASEL